MKAKSIKAGAKFSVKRVKSCKACGQMTGSYLRTGKIISNKSRQGDEVVIVEWDDNLQVTTENVNDLNFKIAIKEETAE